MQAMKSFKFKLNLKLKIDGDRDSHVHCLFSLLHCYNNFFVEMLGYCHLVIQRVAISGAVQQKTKDMRLRRLNCWAA